MAEVGREELSALALVGFSHAVIEVQSVPWSSVPTRVEGAEVVSGFLQLPLPRCDPSTALGLPSALQVGDRRLGRQSGEVIDG